MDETTTIATLKNAVQKMVDDRNWKQFHTPKDLAMNISIEAAELLEHFLWNKPEGHMVTPESCDQVSAEIADILINVMNFCNYTGIDISDAVTKKLAVIDEKYPVEKSRGNPKKYTELP